MDQYHSITTLSNTFKPFLFHSIFTQNLPLHHHIPFLSDALFPEQSGLHILSSNHSISSIYNLQILQIPIYNISNLSISPFHGIPSDPMPPILSLHLFSRSPPSCCLCTLSRGWTLQNVAESAQLFLGSIAGPFVAVLVVVASVMADVTSNPMVSPRENIGQFVG